MQNPFTTTFSKTPESEAEYLAKELVECASISASLDQRMEAIRDRMEAAQEKMS